jgi:hypothetical protein
MNELNMRRLLRYLEKDELWMVYIAFFAMVCFMLFAYYTSWIQDFLDNRFWMLTFSAGAPLFIMLLPQLWKAVLRMDYLFVTKRLATAFLLGLLLNMLFISSIRAYRIVHYARPLADKPVSCPVLTAGKSRKGRGYVFVQLVGKKKKFEISAKLAAEIIANGIDYYRVWVKVRRYNGYIVVDNFIISHI